MQYKNSKSPYSCNMPFIRAALFFILVLPCTVIFAFNCYILLQDVEITNVEWSTLEQCLGDMNSESVSRNISENVWRLIKIAFNGIDNIPAEVYGKITLVLTVIPTDDLRNISMTQVEIVEAFGSVHKSGILGGFNDQQIKVIAQKVRREWLGKNPKTYSEYDLIAMGEIVCHLNVSDINELHADAFKAAAEWIGDIDNCPQAQLQALARLSTRGDAFGAPKDWSKIDVSIIGNILNGLSQSDIESIGKDKLLLNRYYVQKHKMRSQDKVKGANNSTNDINTNNTIVEDN